MMAWYVNGCMLSGVAMGIASASASTGGVVTRTAHAVAARGRRGFTVVITVPPW